MPNNNDYSQFSSFDPDNLPGDESNLPESSSERTNQTNSDGDGNGNGTAQTWDRKKLAQLVDFEEETEQRTAKSAVVASNPSSSSPASGEPDNIVSRDELFDDDDPNLSKTEHTFSNSPWTKGGLVGVGAMVVFLTLPRLKVGGFLAHRAHLPRCSCPRPARGASLPKLSLSLQKASFPVPLGTVRTNNNS